MSASSTFNGQLALADDEIALYKRNAHSLWETVHSQLEFMDSVGLDVDTYLQHFPTGPNFYDVIDQHIRYVVPGARKWTNALFSGRHASRPSEFGLPQFKATDDSGGVYLIEETPGQDIGGAALKFASTHPFAALLVCRPHDKAIVWSDNDWGLYTGQADRVDGRSGRRVVEHDDKLASGTSKSIRDVFQAGLAGRPRNAGPVQGSRRYFLYFNLPKGYDSTIKHILESFVAAHTAWRSDMGSAFADSVGHSQATPICAAMPLNGRHPILTDFENELSGVSALCRALDLLGNGCPLSSHPVQNIQGRQAFWLPASTSLEGNDSTHVKVILIHDRRLIIDASAPPQADFWPRFSTLVDDEDARLSASEILPIRYAWMFRRQAARWFRAIVDKWPTLLPLDDTVIERASQVADKLVKLSVEDALLTSASIVLSHELGLDPRRAQVVRVGLLSLYSHVRCSGAAGLQAQVYVRHSSGGALHADVTETRAEALANGAMPANDDLDGDDDSDAADNNQREAMSVYLRRPIPYDASQPQPEHLDLVRVDGRVYGVSEYLTGSSAVSFDLLVSTGSRATQNREKFESIIASRFERIERTIAQDAILFGVDEEQEGDASESTDNDDDGIEFEQEGEREMVAGDEISDASVNVDEEREQETKTASTIDDASAGLEEEPGREMAAGDGVRDASVGVEEERGRETAAGDEVDDEKTIKNGFKVDSDTTDDEAEAREVEVYLTSGRK